MNRTTRDAITFRTEAETARFAETLAPLLVPGDTLLLDGDLGSGKTHFARALIQARLAVAGWAEDVPSPSFTLVQVYNDGIAEIWHCDLYRLSDPGEVAELGLDDAFEAVICLVEWPDRLEGLAPADALHVALAMTEVPGQRACVLSGVAARWQDRLKRCIGAFANA